jgi:hypothetical protein
MTPVIIASRSLSRFSIFTFSFPNTCQLWQLEFDSELASKYSYHKMCARVPVMLIAMADSANSAGKTLTQGAHATDVAFSIVLVCN